MPSFRTVSRRYALVLTVASALLWSLTDPSRVLSASPVITLQPVSGIATLGENFGFSVDATGTGPLAFQWFFSGSPLAGQTNTQLLLTNLTFTKAGTYFVTVQDSAGSATSSNAVLTVLAGASHRLSTGRLLQSGSQVGLPIVFRANGREHAISFSLLYNSSTFANPVFLPARTDATVTSDTTQPGAVGVALTLPSGNTFAAGNYSIGLLQFDLAPGSNVLQGALLFSTNPIPIAAVDASGAPLAVSAFVSPQFVLATTDATLNLQSGLFEQQLMIGNPGSNIMFSIDVFALNLGFDSRSNAIRLFDAQSVRIAFPFGDPLVYAPCPCCGFALDAPPTGCDFASYLQCSALDCSLDLNGTTPSLPFAAIEQLQPGGSRTVTVELYVSDHFTVPKPTYTLLVDAPIFRIPPANATVLSISTARYTNGTFFVEFPTKLAASYYIQYASTAADLATNALTVLPAVSGTGSNVQWIDNGPPKTDSLPVSGSRFYRVLQSQ